jgi:hypothetical protein
MNANSHSLTKSVKLFPRLASAKPRKLSRTPRIIVRPLEARAVVGARETSRTQVRARLLNMILDNEQARRNDRHPNAS